MVDDDLSLLKGISDALSLIGLDVEGFPRAAPVLDELSTRPLPCAILLDLRMPEMSGWEFRDRLRLNSRLAAVPVVAITALPAREWHPFDGPVLSKPFHWEEVLTYLDRLPCGRKPVSPR